MGACRRARRAAAHGSGSTPGPHSGSWLLGALSAAAAAAGAGSGAEAMEVPGRVGTTAAHSGGSGAEPGGRVRYEAGAIAEVSVQAASCQTKSRSSVSTLPSSRVTKQYVVGL